MYCHKCGAQIPDGSRFCNSCGADVSMTSQPVERIIAEEPQKSGEQPKAKTNKGGLGKAFIYIFLLLLIIGACWFFFTPELNNVYHYSKVTYSSDYPITEDDKADVEDLFIGTYLYKKNDEYYVANLETGLGFSSKDIKEKLTAEDGFTMKIEINPNNLNYAYLTMEEKSTNTKITVSYIKASIGERLAFISKCYF